mmetsp:Transcript_17065/g.30588  ORF Transcript_17065/g.30588 Transcript_17065/m.30588 type:complete len:107 (-) Transcript_17065:85-405(-)
MEDTSAASWPRDEQRVRWSKGDDARVKDKAELWAKRQCAPLMEPFAKCAKDKVVTIYKCSDLRDAYVNCLKDHVSETYMKMHKRESVTKRLAELQQAQALEKSTKR